VRKVLENRSLQDEERANQVEEQLKEAQSLAEGAFIVFVAKNMHQSLIQGQNELSTILHFLKSLEFL
jgi:hypothetical protein